MNKEPVVIVEVGGEELIGWEDVSISRALDEASSSFRLTIADPDEDTVQILKLHPGSHVKIKYGEDLLVTGYIDSINVDFSDTNHTLTFEGRSKTKDLVDCSALTTTQFKNQTILQIAQKLAEPYGVQVICTEHLEPIPNFQVEATGETVFDAIQRLADEHQLCISDTPSGKLVLTRVGAYTTKNELLFKTENNTTTGKNSGIKSGSMQLGEHNRYSEIVVKGQSRATDKSYGKQASQIIASVLDDEMKRKRVKVIIADVELSTNGASQRAHWEMKAAKSKGLEINYTVQGWTGSAGIIWRENELITVTNNLFGIVNKTLVISKVEYNLSSSGTTANLDLRLPESFEKEKKEKTGTKTKSSKKKSVGSVTTFWKEGDAV